MVTVGLTDDGARPDDFPPLAPRVARSTDVIQPAKGRGQVFGLGQGALAGGFPRAIDVKDHPVVSRSIHQAPGLLARWREWAAEQIIEKERAQGFDGLLGQRRQKAREGRAGGQLVTLKQGHEGDGKGLEPLVEGLQRAFSADGIAEEDRKKIDHLVVPEAPPRKAHLLADLGQDTVLAKMRRRSARLRQTRKGSRERTRQRSG